LGLPQGDKHHLRLDTDDKMTIRQELADGGVFIGSAQRRVAGTSGSQTQPQALPLLFAGGQTVPGFGPRGGPESSLPLDVPGIQAALDQGLNHLAAHWPGLTDTDRDQMRQQFQQLATPLAGMLAHNGSFAQAVQGFVTQMGDDDSRQQPLLRSMETLGMSLTQLLSGSTTVLGDQRRQQGVPQALMNSWLDQHSLTNICEVEPDWCCPICFDCSKTNLVKMCQDDHGGTIHAFHRQCIADWLVRRNECPTCRRTPAIELPSSG